MLHKFMYIVNRQILFKPYTVGECNFRQILRFYVKVSCQYLITCIIVFKFIRCKFVIFNDPWKRVFSSWGGASLLEIIFFFSSF